MADKQNPAYERVFVCDIYRGPEMSHNTTCAAGAGHNFKPRWIRDIKRFLNIKSQFVLSGNIRDIYPFYNHDKAVPLQLKHYLRENLAAEGFQYYICYDPIDGFSPLHEAAPESEKTANDFFSANFGIDFKNGAYACSTVKAFEVIKKIVDYKEAFVSVFVDFASRLIINPSGLSADEKDFFSAFLKLSYTAFPHITVSDKTPKYNPIFWICDKENDFPSWFFVNNPKIRPVVISRPDSATRKPFIALISKAIKGFNECGDVKKKEIITSFAESTEGMYNSDIIAITQLARSEGLVFDSIAEAVRRYKIGVTEDPWARLDKDKIKNAREIIERRIKGQPQAVIKTLDVIKRSVTGLSGAAHSKASGKPRGVMFLAGPTGTGKTEIAKAITELIFGDEKAYIRFDMSEFSAEHSDQRLLGAPPGYVGYDAGGELTNAVREKPFSVILFDEIEKAHPKILDKFLQILEDGRLTDGSGNTVYFSESIIVFTSNLGIYRQDETGRKVQNVNQEMDFCEVEARIRSEIDNYFKLVLGRPEILNRIGENIIVFDFIRENTASQIFDKIMRNIIERLYENNKIALAIPESICDQIRRICVSDLSNGGRGIGNKIETVFLNPLSRALFDLLIEERGEAGNVKNCAIKTFTEHEGVYNLEI